MGAKQEQNRLLREQRERCWDLLEQGWSKPAVEAREGVDPKTLKDYVKEGRAAGRKFPKNGKSPDQPFGQTDNSKVLRQNLNTTVHRLLERKGHRPEILSRALGVTNRPLNHMRQHPLTPYDWKLSQIERLTAFLDVDFTVFMGKLQSPLASFIVYIDDLLGLSHDTV